MVYCYCEVVPDCRLLHWNLTTNIKKSLKVETSIIYLYTKFLVDRSIRSKVIRGPKISKLGHVTLSLAPFEPETLSLCTNPSSHTYCHFFASSLIHCWVVDERAILKAKLGRVTWPGGKGHPKPQSADITFMGLWWRLREFTWSIPHCKVVLGRKFCPVKTSLKNGGFFGNKRD